MKRKRVFFRTLLRFFIIIGCAYTLIATSVFFYKNDQINRMRMDNAQRAFLEQAAEKMDVKLQIAGHIANLLRNNQSLINYAKSSEINYYDVTKLYDELKNYNGLFFSAGYRIDVTKPNQDLIVSSTNTMNVKRFQEELGMNSETIATLQQFYSSKDQIRSTMMLKGLKDQRTGKSMFTWVKRELIWGQKVYFYISFYEKDFLPAVEEDQSFIVFYKQNPIAMATEGSLDPVAAIYDKFRKTWPVLIKPGELLKGNNLEDSVDGYKLRVRSTTLYDDWQYAYITPIPGLFYNVSELLGGAASIFVAMLILCVGIGLFAANKVYRPVKTVIQAFGGEDLSQPNDEFQFLQDTARNIRMANEQLKETLLTQQLPMRNKILRDMLLGLIPDEKKEHHIEELKLEILREPFTVVIIEFTRLKIFQDRSLTKDAIMQIQSQAIYIIEEAVKAKALCQVMEWEHKRYLILIQEIDGVAIKQWFEDAIYTIEAEYELGLAAAVGKPAQHVNEIEEAYYSALRLLDYPAVVEKKTIITDEDIKQLHTASYYYPLDMERDLMYAVLRGKEDEALAILNRILEENLNHLHSNQDMLTQLWFEMRTTVNRILQQVNIDQDQLKNSWLLSGTEWHTPEDLARMITSYFTHLIHLIHDENQQFGSSAADQMMEYIHEHYVRDLSLKDIADHFSLSSGYVSTLFKQHTGENFKDYLNIYRVKKAKQIMDGETVKIADLAIRVGCNSANTFIRIFKKYEGISPGQYAGKGEPM
ncbi:hypothetical protein SY83_16825 [Paenibacillus swuensis]|uniref:HTH araC/xylS-type domain-containing protein n=1 Tax=Paenibacillus swuensis TaxID=1178515 RepID=A0A172TL12_9BACL|nr:AraC family transcriptional regulator [Paenibacillus swuensis]ANE47672.1 hypothetical protein SY83_16825 [Paenibacillus swuensis]